MNADPFFRRDADLKPRAGTIVAEFANGFDALHFARAKGHEVTAGINLAFAVRVKAPESAAVHPSADSSQPAPQVPESGCGFQLTAREPRTIAVLRSVMSRLPHTEDSL